MLKDIVYEWIRVVALIHDRALALNDAYGLQLTDKQLHFWFFGVAGAAVFLALWALCAWLRRHPALLAWLFGFAVMLTVALAVEVGQWLTDTGAMQFKDIAAGMIGYVVISAGTALVALLLRAGRKKRRR